MPLQSRVMPAGSRVMPETSPGFGGTGRFSADLRFRLLFANTHIHPDGAAFEAELLTELALDEPAVPRLEATGGEQHRRPAPGPPPRREQPLRRVAPPARRPGSPGRAG